jgi:hypothetical protein
VHGAQELEKQIADPQIAGDPRKLQEVCVALAGAQAEVERLYARWQELEEKHR